MVLGPQSRRLLAEPMPTVVPSRQRPLPMLARLDTNTEYVLPHAPPPQPVQPAGDRFVESAVNNTLPALEPWPGQHRFRVSVRTPPPAQHGRQPPYVFDRETNKLYVDMIIAVTFAFRVAEGTDTTRLRVSALPVYPDMHHVNTPVRRCPTHRLPELECNNGAGSFIDHVIRAEHDDAVYQEGGTTKERRSVVVPYERPPPGTLDYLVSYRFCCMNTCVGGINRRRLMVLFTLEDSSTGEALGRQSVEVKVCKCPHRDARTDRSRALPKQRRPASSPDPQEPPARRPCPAGRLVVEVDDMIEYDHLKAVLASFRAARRSLLRARSTSDSAAPAPPASVSSDTTSSERDSPAERRTLFKTEAP
ncbi:cellular tumor antigen p53-like isoform X2 [Amphibalanus amphitrite]|uniref:cellular tumor antigen p53-like isoform X2 n=1 Tax=Amphibalanus amphitrite TaxID=1232801 RepID=UPI001C90A001|nr:cellular tumor antigen p53-like isoform X2 [Amphibalanus amphitrite]